MHIEILNVSITILQSCRFRTLNYTQYMVLLVFYYGKIENGNGECVKETTKRPKSGFFAEGYQRIFNTTSTSRT